MMGPRFGDFRVLDSGCEVGVEGFWEVLAKVLPA